MAVRNLESIRECARCAFLYFVREAHCHRGDKMLRLDALADRFFAMRNHPENALQEGGLDVFREAVKEGGPVFVLHLLANCFEDFSEIVDFTLKKD